MISFIQLIKEIRDNEANWLVFKFPELWSEKTRMEWPDLVSLTGARSLNTLIHQTGHCGQSTSYKIFGAQEKIIEYLLWLEYNHRKLDKYIWMSWAKRFRNSMLHRFIQADFIDWNWNRKMNWWMILFII